MSGTKEDLIRYRMLRARDTFEDAQILADKLTQVSYFTNSLIDAGFKPPY
jgi:hypothetical protein